MSGAERSYRIQRPDRCRQDRALFRVGSVLGATVVLWRRSYGGALGQQRRSGVLVQAAPAAAERAPLIEHRFGDGSVVVPP